MTSGELPHDDQKPDKSPVEEERKEGGKQPSTNEARRQIRVRVGQQLRATRERREMTLPEASSQLRIRKNYLEALEKGNWRKLPGEVYALGFLRQYAALLDSDVQEDLEALKSGEYRLTKPFTMPDPPIAPNRMWAIAAGILFALLFILFNAVDNGKDAPQSPEAPFTVTPPPPAQDAAPLEKAPRKEAAETNTTPDIQRQEAPLPSVSPASAVTPAAPVQTENQSAASPARAPVEIHRYLLTAVGATLWIQVHDHDGTLIKEALLQPGEHFQLENSEPFLLLTCGNAAALQIMVDNELYAAAGTLGESGEVLRDFRIETPD